MAAMSASAAASLRRDPARGIVAGVAAGIVSTRRGALAPDSPGVQPVSESARATMPAAAVPSALAAAVLGLRMQRA